MAQSAHRIDYLGDITAIGALRSRISPVLAARFEVQVETAVAVVAIGLPWRRRAPAVRSPTDRESPTAAAARLVDVVDGRSSGHSGERVEIAARPRESEADKTAASPFR